MYRQKPTLPMLLFKKIIAKPHDIISTMSLSNALRLYFYLKGLITSNVNVT